MSTNRPADADDVQRARKGDREAFGRLFDRHARAVRALVGGVSGDFAAVDDLTQETFLRGYRQLNMLREPAAFGTWIQGIARHVARERVRNLRRERHRFHADRNEPAIQEEAESVLECEDEHQRLLAAVAELPERERLAVHAFYFHEQDAEQAATAIGLSRSGFYAALNRGIRRLRKRLGANPSSPTATRDRQ
jgi:RNA polymerase sigma-70 factor (ECF subfamily)